jgi:quercetin dioxygenase-like cupin family protein
VHVDRYGSDFSISRLFHSEHLHVGCMRLGPGGVVGYHRAASHQLFAVVEGEGWVRGAGPDRIPIQAGQAALWESGEEHEAGTDTGMVAIVVEGEALASRPENIGPVPPRENQAAF